MKNIRAKLGWLRRRPHQVFFDYRNIKKIKDNINEKKYIYYFGVPEHSNLGDLAQCYCIRRYFNKYFSDYEVIEVFSRNYLDNSFGLRDYLKSAIKQEDLIFFQSGYCTQDLGGREDLMHVLLSGNETGMLLLDYICSRRTQMKTMPEDPVTVKTIVTIDMAERIAAKYGVKTINVLTGFKFIGEQIGFLEKQGKEDSYIFGI